MGVCGSICITSSGNGWQVTKGCRKVAYSVARPIVLEVENNNSASFRSNTCLTLEPGYTVSAMTATDSRSLTFTSA